jgi:Fe2+ or Zn2+ uptake regulation protein
MKDDSTVRNDISEFLKENAGSGASLQSIATWWVLRQQATTSPTIVQQAIKQLMEAEVVNERQTPDGRTVYFLREQQD